MGISENPSNDSLSEQQSFLHDDSESFQVEARNSRYSKGRFHGLRRFVAFASIILSAASMFLILTHIAQLRTNTADISIQSSPTSIGSIMKSPCGSTPDEARAAGCNFDVISFCWLPDRCYDKELSQGFDDMHTWEWFLDPNKTQPVSHEQAMTGEFDGLFVNWEYHLRHCTAMWEKMHRALIGEGKLAVDGYIGSLNHTRHCSHMLLSDRDVSFEAINTIILVKYPDCGIE